MLASETRVGYSSSVMSTDQRAFSVAVAAAAAAAFACGAAAGIWYTRKHYATKPQHSLRLNLDRIVPSTPGNLSPTASVLSVPQTPRETPRRSSSMDSSAFSRSSSLNGGLGAGSDKFKMVMVVRKDLGWNRQKTTVMCAHICLAMFKKLYKGRHPYLTAWVSRLVLGIAYIAGKVHVHTNPLSQVIMSAKCDLHAIDRLYKHGMGQRLYNERLRQ